MNILGIETSCDETAVAIIEKTDDNVIVRANVVSSQIELHRAWGGVVPNLAGREHAKNIIPVLEEALSTAKIYREDIDLIAITSGPGLIPALLIGVTTAKVLAYSLRKPLLGIHHIEGHIYANWLPLDVQNSPKAIATNDQKPSFPALCLVVSGGHTQIVLMPDHCTYTIIGQTQDDAVGEAFDKVARLLGLPYPGGPEIASCAEKYNTDTNPHTITLPRPMIKSDNYNFSFSGIKTAVLYTVREYQKTIICKNTPHKNTISKKEYDAVVLPEKFVQAVAHEFQKATIEVLVYKTVCASKEHAVASVLIAGGVSANIYLRNQLRDALKENCATITYHVPLLEYCLDNATMIAMAGAYRWSVMTKSQKENAKNGWLSLYANPNLPMTSLEQ